MFDLRPSHIPGCVELQPRVFDDARGRFVKVHHEQAFAQLGLETAFAEQYYSVSRKGVLRGMHFQLPPMDHVKMVYCVRGEVLDAVVDLRVGSPTYGQHALFRLSAAQANSIYIPKGLAHGFLTLSDDAIMVYNVTTTYSAEHDSGVLWNSTGIGWPVDAPIMSERDKSFPALDRFVSPFRYE